MAVQGKVQLIEPALAADKKSRRNRRQVVS
jgi:hypothetical protein